MFYFCAAKRHPKEVISEVVGPVFVQSKDLIEHYEKNPLPDGCSLICFEGDYLGNNEYKIINVSRVGVDLTEFDNAR